MKEEEGPKEPSCGKELGRVGLLRAVVRAMSLRACSGEVGPLLALDHCRMGSTLSTA